MNVIDIASYQKALNLNNISYDGVAIKATEGLGYVNPYCDTHYQQAKAAGKKRAVYHFYDFSADAVAQADTFVDNCAGYIRDAIFVLDWEGSGVGDVGAALRFLQRVEQRIGYKPAIYMSEWVENHYDWSSVVRNDNGLWVAKYSDYEIDNNYDMTNAGAEPNVTHWPFYFMWQWTSKGRINGYAGDLDCDVAYLNSFQWDAYAGVQAPAPAPQPVITTQDVAESKAVPYDTQTVQDATVAQGTTVIKQAGAAGVETIVYTITYQDGVEQSRVVKSDDITTQPTTQIVVVGTFVPSPAPDPQPQPTPAPTPDPSQPANVFEEIALLLASLWSFIQTVLGVRK